MGLKRITANHKAQIEQCAVIQAASSEKLNGREDQERRLGGCLGISR